MSLTTLLKSRSPKPLATCTEKAAVAVAPSGVGVSAICAAACDSRRSLSISLAAKPGLKPLLDAEPGTGPGMGHILVRMKELADEVDITSYSVWRETPSFSPRFLTVSFSYFPAQN